MSDEQPQVFWRVKQLSCDGGHLGKTRAEHFFADKAAAEWFLKRLVDGSNARALASCDTDPHAKASKERAEAAGHVWWNLFHEDTVDGVTGYCRWAYSEMIVLDSITITNEGFGHVSV